MRDKNCEIITSEKRITVGERGRKFTLVNQEQEKVLKVEVDGCLIKQGERCDYLFELFQRTASKQQIVEGKAPCRCVIFVELKGADIKKAFDQLVATIGNTQARHDEAIKICHIVSSRVPRFATKSQTLTLDMRRKHNAHLKIKSSAMEIDISKSPYTKV